MKILALLLLATTAAPADEQLWYPFAPYRDPNDAKVAAAFRRRLEQEGGAARAVRRVCASGEMWAPVEAEVASNFLVERAPETYPALLDALVKEENAVGAKDNSNCRGNLEGTARFGLCNGYTSFLGGPDLDAHPLAVARRAGARQAIAKAIAGGGPRGQRAMDVLLEAGSWANGLCPGLLDAVQTATPVLVRWLGVPKPPLEIPGSVHQAEEKWDQALRALSFGGADRALAEKPVRAFLADDVTAPLAALALARMGVDVAAEAPRLGRILEGIVFDRQNHKDQRQLTLVGDIVDALGAIGKPARAALPNIGAFVARAEMPGCHSLGAARYIHLVQAIATEADTADAVAALAPLLGCQDPAAPVVRALVDLGPGARAPILRVLRDDTRPIRERLASVDALLQLGQTFDAPDAKLVALLRTKAKGAPTELERCRAEAGLPPAPTAPTAPAPPPSELMTCLAQYLCGPTQEVYQRTIQRCCQGLARYQKPDICGGVRNAGPVAAPPTTPSPP